MDVGRDWDLFATLLTQELAELGASPDEADVIIDRSWHRATEVESVADYARGALELARSGAFPYDRRVESDGEASHLGPGRRERDPDQG